VVARLAGIEEPIDKPATRIRLRAVGETWVPAQRAGAFAEAVMELGATVCTPRAPACNACPLRGECRALERGATSRIPARSPRRPKTVVRVAFARVRRDGQLLLVRRPTGLLRGLWSLPTLAREAGTTSVFGGLSLEEAGLIAGRTTRVGELRHVFTHRDVTAEVFDVTVKAVAEVDDGPGHERRWVDDERLDDLATSSFLRKLLALKGERSLPEPPRAKRDKRLKTP
jgi:A/G-specific adenine glycosylase